jgi:hypothetical protein
LSRLTKDSNGQFSTPLTALLAVPEIISDYLSSCNGQRHWRWVRMIDQALKEGVIRSRLDPLGFELERDDLGWIVRDRREHLDMPDMPALNPIKFPNLDSIIDLFKFTL